MLQIASAAAADEVIVEQEPGADPAPVMRGEFHAVRDALEAEGRVPSPRVPPVYRAAGAIYGFATGAVRRVVSAFKPRAQRQD